jgi:hypothetical protein
MVGDRNYVLALGPSASLCRATQRRHLHLEIDLSQRVLDGLPRKRPLAELLDDRLEDGELQFRDLDGRTGGFGWRGMVTG